VGFIKNKTMKAICKVSFRNESICAKITNSLIGTGASKGKDPVKAPERKTRV
jgi:hypothetical protein